MLPFLMEQHASSVNVFFVTIAIERGSTYIEATVMKLYVQLTMKFPITVRKDRTVKTMAMMTFWVTL